MNLEDLRLKQAHFEFIRQDKQKYYRNLEKLRQQFIKKFTIPAIEKMDKEDYVEGKMIKGEPNKNTFCYWVEYRTVDLGKIKGARVDKFGLYVDKESQKYKFIKRFDNENDALSFLKNQIIKLITFGKNKKLEEIKRIELSPMFKGKILFLHYPNTFINIFSEDHVDYFLKKLSMYYENKNLDLIDKREILLKWKNKDSIMKKWDIIEFTDFLYNEFRRPPKDFKIPDKLKKYVDLEEEYPDPKKVQAKYFKFEIDTEKKLPSSKERRGINKIVDFEKENKRKKRLGDQGELIVYYKEKDLLTEHKREDLAEKVIPMFKEKPSAGYDILSYDLDGTEKYIEVKSTNNSPANRVKFIITINEYKKAKELKNYYIYIVFNTKSRNPKIGIIENPFKFENKGLYLSPKSFQAIINTKSIKTK